MDLTTVRFGHGAHRPDPNPTGDRDMCIMEAVAFVAGEPWSDRPSCASPVIAAMLRSWNDDLPAEDRDRFLPADVWVPSLISSRGTSYTETRRAYLVFNWLVRVYMPAWLDLVPTLAEHAAALRSLPEIAVDPGGLVPRFVEEAIQDVYRASCEAGQAPICDFYDAWRLTGGAAAIRSAAWHIQADWVTTRRIFDIATTIAVTAGVDLTPTITTQQQSFLNLLNQTLLCGAKDGQ